MASAASLGLALAAQRYTPPAVEVEPLAMHASCSAEANAEVDRGAALVVLLATEEARRAFERAANADADCALAYWGQAVSALPAADEPLTMATLDVGAALAQRAAAVPARSPLERGLVGTMTTLFAPAGATPIGVRLDGYQQALGQLMQSNPMIEALPILQARAVLLRSTLPGDAARARAAAIVDAAFRNRPLPAGAAVTLLQASEGTRSPAVARRAVEALSRVTLPAPHHLVMRALVATGDWNGAIREGEAALRAAGTAMTSALLYGQHADYAGEWLVEGYLQQGRRAAARTLVVRLNADLAHVTADEALHATLQRGIARAAARVIVDARTLPEPVSPLDLPQDTRQAWTLRFADGLVAGWRAWPGGDAARLETAGAALTDLGADAIGSSVEPETALARALVEATMAASQDEHPQVTLLMAHATALETELIDTGRLSLPLLPARELLAEIWLRFYRYADAEREARAALARWPNHWRAWLTLARATTALKRQDEARDAYRQVAEIRAAADAEDPARQEALNAAR